MVVFHSTCVATCVFYFHITISSLTNAGYCTESYPCKGTCTKLIKTYTLCNNFFVWYCTKYSRVTYTCDTTCSRQVCCSGYQGSGCSTPICYGSTSCLNNNHCVSPDKCSCRSGYQQPQCEDVNECDNANGDCSHVCTNTIGSYYCSCENGYMLHANDRVCIDVNECDNGNGDCSHTCTNTNGAYYCGCENGYMLNADYRECIDVDECATGTSQCDQICVNTPGTYTCDCYNSYNLTDDHSCSDRPSAPTNFQYSEGTLKETSVTLTWVPGFNGGLTQTFVIQYKTGTDQSWTKVEDIPANATNHNLIWLSGGTKYTAHMYAYNSNNESDRTTNITFTTAKHIVTEIPPNNAALIGGAVGGSVAAIIIAVLVAVILLKMRKQGLARTAKERQTATYTDLTIPGNTSNIYDPIQRETHFSGDAANTRSESLNVDGSNNMYAGLSQCANLQNTHTSLDNVNSCNKQSDNTYENLVISPR